MLSTILAGCAGAIVERPGGVVGVRVDNIPPAELLRCPEAPAPFPTDAAAVIPADVRQSMIGLARGYRAAADQLTRLIAWAAPGSCADR